MMLMSGRIVEAFPGDRIIVALAALSLFSVAGAIFAAFKMNATHRYALEGGGRLTADSARLRLAMVGIGAAALIQASHAEVYSFATIQWREAGLSGDLISAAWATGVASESFLFVVAARRFTTDRSAVAFLFLGAVGATLRWIAMSLSPGPYFVIAYCLSRKCSRTLVCCLIINAPGRRGFSLTFSVYFPEASRSRSALPIAP